MRRLPNRHVFEVGTATEDGDFQNFQSRIKRNDFRVDWDTFEVAYNNSDGDQLRFRYDTDRTPDDRGFIWLRPALWVNSDRLDNAAEHWPVVESPAVTLRNRVLEVERGGQSFRIDWRDSIPAISSED